MSRIVALTLSVIALTVAGLATAATAGAEDEGTTYQRYADVRERLYACHFEVIQGTQTSARQADCRNLARYYVLYGPPGGGSPPTVPARTATHCTLPPPPSRPQTVPIPPTR